MQTPNPNPNSLKNWKWLFLRAVTYFVSLVCCITSSRSCTIEKSAKDNKKKTKQRAYLYGPIKIALAKKITSKKVERKEKNKPYILK